ncbi:MAG: hypothetical protein KJ057_07255 [Phycisphaerae bacterium]|nr:MAG: hypothetical protein F9K17_08030 [Phycisphaerae bacterium]MBE7457054.1 hypothetical protein [Planctomycetia bacterium]MCK6463588.1 globin domain-containing protein [Phycisphaerae bacterium]MCL4718256.1 hypothetical protein [Phycisphaerae bacterium]NUQ07858.1 hypothetical protein [Phycisphaerae bacterium]
MDRACAARLASSFMTVAHRGEELVTRFYALLFARHPELRPLFPASLHERKNAMLASLVRLAKSLHAVPADGRPDSAFAETPLLFGVGIEGKEAACDVFVELLGSISGASWTPPLAQDWRELVMRLDEDGAQVYAESGRDGYSGLSWA